MSEKTNNETKPIETGEKLVEDLGELPEVTDSISGPVNPFAGLVDTRGREFDKDLHAVDDSGNPIITTKGKLKLKKRGRPAKGETKAAVSVDSGIESRIGGVSPGPAPEEIQSRALGVYSANLLISLGRSIGGEEWEPRKDEAFDERENLEIAFGDYFAAKELKDIPPGIALSLAVSTYIGPRLFMPTTKKRTLSFMDKMKLLFMKKKLEKKAESREVKPGERQPEEKGESSQG